MSLRNGVLAVVLMLFALSVNAAMVAKDAQGNSVTLQETACVSDPWLKDWKAATMFYQGRVFAACWRLQGNLVIILDSAGDITPIPMTAFRPETSV